MREVTAQVDAVCPVNWLHDLNRGLVSWWKCIPGWTGGQRWHDLCRRNHGLLVNMDPARDWVSRADRLGGYGALDLDGDDDVVLIGNDKSVDIGPAITIAAWVKYADVDSDFDGILVRTGDYNEVLAKYAFYLGDSTVGNERKLEFIMENADAPKISADASLVVPTGRWAFVAVSANAAKTIFMRDGRTETQSGLVGLAPSYSGELTTIGAWRDGGNHDGFFQGQIDDVRLYNRALSEFELTQLYRENVLGNPGTLNRLKRWFFPPSETPPPDEVALVTTSTLGMIPMDQPLGTTEPVGIHNAQALQTFFDGGWRLRKLPLLIEGAGWGIARSTPSRRSTIADRTQRLHHKRHAAHENRQLQPVPQFPTIGTRSWTGEGRFSLQYLRCGQSVE